MSAIFTACVTLMSATGTTEFNADASTRVSSATKSDTTAAIPAPVVEPRARISAIQRTAYAATDSPATSMVGAHATPATCAHTNTMTDAAIALAACSSDMCTASDEALKASVNTANAPKSGHGGIDEAGSVAM